MAADAECLPVGHPLYFNVGTLLEREEVPGHRGDVGVGSVLGLLLVVVDVDDHELGGIASERDILLNVALLFIVEVLHTV